MTHFPPPIPNKLMTDITTSEARMTREHSQPVLDEKTNGDV